MLWFIISVRVIFIASDQKPNSNLSAPCNQTPIKERLKVWLYPGLTGYHSDVDSLSLFLALQPQAWLCNKTPPVLTFTTPSLSL